MDVHSELVLITGLPYALSLGTTVAAATTPPATISVSSSSGPVGSVVTVSAAIIGPGCSSVMFDRAKLAAAGSTPFDTVATVDNGYGRFMVPSYLGGIDGGERVQPGLYRFSVTCNATHSPSTAFTTTAYFEVTSTAVPSGRFVSMSPTPTGHGYWLVGADGGVFTFGDAGFYGNVVTTQMGHAQPVIALRATSNGRGYFEAEDLGSIFAYGNAAYEAIGVTSATATLISGFATVPNASFGWLSGTDGGCSPCRCRKRHLRPSTARFPASG